VKSVKITLYDYTRLLNYFHISTCWWSTADLSTTINFNIYKLDEVICFESRVESQVITSESRVKSESYRGWDSSRVTSHPKRDSSRDSSQVASRESTAMHKSKHASYCCCWADLCQKAQKWENHNAIWRIVWGNDLHHSSTAQDHSIAASPTRSQTK